MVTVLALLSGKVCVGELSPCRSDRGNTVDVLIALTGESRRITSSSIVGSSFIIEDTYVNGRELQDYA